MQAQRKATTRPQMVGYRPGAPKQNGRYKQPIEHYTARDAEERGLKTGFLLGLCVGLLACGLVLWLWVIPTMDGAVEMARQAVEAAS